MLFPIPFLDDVEAIVDRHAGLGDQSVVNRVGDRLQILPGQPSAIVNLERVQEMHPLFRGDGMLVLKEGTRLRISRARREEFERRVR